MNIYDQGHHALNPIGHFEPVCDSLGHDWKSMWLMDQQYRTCRRCERMERRVYTTDHQGVYGLFWEVNVVKPSVA